MRKTGIACAILMFFAAFGIESVNAQVHMWNLEFDSPDNLYVHETSPVPCAGDAWRALSADLRLDHPEGIIPAVAGYTMTLFDINGDPKEIWVAEGSGDLHVAGAANPGRFSGTVTPTTKWTIGKTYQVRGVDVMAYQTTKAGNFICAAKDQTDLDAWLQFMELLGGLL